MSSNSTHQHVTTDTVRIALLSDTPPVIVDVRTPQEYAAYHIPRSILCPLDQLPGLMTQFQVSDDLVIVCEHGIRSAMAAQYLAAHGYERVATMDGGMAEYEGEVVNGY